MSEGFRIKRSWARVEPALVEAFRPLPVANVSDSMFRMDHAGAELRPMHREGSLAGPAFTVRSRPGDNLMLHKAIDMAEAGDVIVCDAGGDLTNALFGEMMLAHAIKRGIAGLVLNGAVRDRDALLDSAIPVYAAGVTHRGPYKDGPGEIGFAIALAGMVIQPGDLVLGDADGVLAVPRASVPEVLARSQAKFQAEQKQMAAILDGSVDRSWVDRTLEERGCVYID